MALISVVFVADKFVTDEFTELIFVEVSDPVTKLVELRLEIKALSLFIAEDCGDEDSTYPPPPPPIPSRPESPLSPLSPFGPGTEIYLVTY